MAFIREILATIDDVVDYKITIVGNNGVIVEGFKSVIFYSNEKIELRVAKTKLIIDGAKLIINELSNGFLSLTGKVSNIALAGKDNE